MQNKASSIPGQLNTQSTGLVSKLELIYHIKRSELLSINGIILIYSMRCGRGLTSYNLRLSLGAKTLDIIH